MARRALSCLSRLLVRRPSEGATSLPSCWRGSWRADRAASCCWLVGQIPDVYADVGQILCLNSGGRTARTIAGTAKEGAALSVVTTDHNETRTRRRVPIIGPMARAIACTATHEHYHSVRAYIHILADLMPARHASTHTTVAREGTRVEAHSSSTSSSVTLIPWYSCRNSWLGPRSGWSVNL